MADEIITLVDQHNTIIGSVARRKMKFGIDYHRATYILVFTPDNHLIVQKRSATKSFCPSFYGITTGGIVAEGESYLISAQRELKEELGIDLELTSHGIFLTEGKEFRIWGKLFSCHYDEKLHGPLTLQASEVASTHIMSIESIQQQLSDTPFTPDSVDAFKHYVNQSITTAPDDPA